MDKSKTTASSIFRRRKRGVWEVPNDDRLDDATADERMEIDDVATR